VLPDHVIAIAEPTARTPIAHPPFETSAHLLGEILEEERIHGALEA
jgi:hypothetical protein